MMRSFLRGLGLFLLLGMSPLTARAQSEEGAAAGESLEVVQARKHFGQGLKLYKDGDFDAALVQFERAHAVKPNYKVLYNIAQCHFELRQYVEARDTLRRYLKEGADAIDAERRQAVENDLTELHRRIAHLKLAVNVQGASVYIDGKKVGTTPLSTRVDVSEGQRTIAVEAQDRGSKQRVVRVAGGEEQLVEIQFEELGKPLAAGVSVPRDLQPRPDGGLGAAFWLTGAGALMLGAGAGVTGYLALRAEDRREDRLDTPNVQQSELDEARDEAKVFALTTDILAGGALLFATVATVLLITDDSDTRQVAVGVGPGQLGLRGKF